MHLAVWQLFGIGSVQFQQWTLIWTPSSSQFVFVVPGAVFYRFISVTSWQEGTVFDPQVRRSRF